MPVRVFISYTHDNEPHRESVLALANRLVSEGIDVHLDRYVEGGTPSQGWPAWMEDKVREADFVLVVCSAVYYRRYRRGEPPGVGLGGRWEANLIRDDLYGNPERLRKYVPVLAVGAGTEDVPDPLRYAATRYRLVDGYDDLYFYLTGQPEVQKPSLGPVRARRARHREIEPEASERFSAPIRERFGEIGRVVSKLTEEQHRVIQELRGQRRALISGRAGSGKTLVAVEKAIRLSHAGVSTLFLCHNPRLADWVASLTEGTDVVVTAFEDLVARLACEAAPSAWSNYSQPTAETLDAAMNELLSRNDGVEAVIVDEGQDFDPAWWELVEATMGEAAGGILYIFFDDQQALLPFRAQYPIEGPAHDLTRNCRNAGRVYELMRTLTPGAPPPAPALERYGETMLVHDGSGRLGDAVVTALRWLSDRCGLENCVAVLGGAVSFEHSVLARSPFEIGGPPLDWKAGVAHELDRLRRAHASSVRHGAATLPVDRVLGQLSDEQDPTPQDVEALRSAVSSFGLPIARRPSLRWVVQRPTRGNDTSLPPTLVEARYERTATQSELVGAFRDGTWVDALPVATSVTFRPHDWTLDGEVPVYGVGEIKGLERDVVLVVMQGDAPELLHELYVGVSRARAVVAVVADERAYALLPPRLQRRAHPLASDTAAAESQIEKRSAKRRKQSRRRSRRDGGRAWS